MSSIVPLRFLPLACALALAPLSATEAADTQPTWLRKPTAADLMGVWPANALKKGVGGEAVITCEVTAQGALRACRVASETPAGGGFGSAAIALAPQFLMNPATRDGVPVASRVSIPINFEKPPVALGSRIRTLGSGEKMTQMVSNLAWLTAPAYADVLAAYPQKAKDANVGGIATMNCRITSAGSIRNCEVLRSEPRGYGFDTAARSLAGKFTAPTTTAKGESLVSSFTQVQVTFAADSLSAPKPLIGRPKWVAVPKLEDFAAALPAEARRTQTYKARVVLECTVAQGGSLEGCRTESEEPAGLGYGAATLALSKGFRLGVWSEEGLPTVGGLVRIPLRWDLDAQTVASAARP